jgi:hypothetical protein
MDAPNINLITELPRYSDGEINQAFYKEIVRGFKLERETEKGRVDQAAKEAKTNAGKTHPVLGKCVANIPAREYFRLVNKYGEKEVLSPEFLRDYNKRFPELSPNKA